MPPQDLATITPFRFGDVPAEVRNLVYEELLVRPSSPICFTFDYYREFGDDGRRGVVYFGEDIQHGILQTSSQVNKEATPILYGKNSFFFDMPDDFERVWVSLGNRNHRCWPHIQNISLSVGHPEGPTRRWIRIFLTRKMPTLPRLRRLELRFMIWIGSKDDSRAEVKRYEEMIAQLKIGNGHLQDFKCSTVEAKDIPPFVPSSDIDAGRSSDDSESDNPSDNNPGSSFDNSNSNILFGNDDLATSSNSNSTGSLTDGDNPVNTSDHDHIVSSSNSNSAESLTNDHHPVSAPDDDDLVTHSENTSDDDDTETIFENDSLHSPIFNVEEDDPWYEDWDFNLIMERIVEPSTASLSAESTN
jgi:hypothetical protein